MGKSFIFDKLQVYSIAVFIRQDYLSHFLVENLQAPRLSDTVYWVLFLLSPNGG